VLISIWQAQHQIAIIRGDGSLHAPGDALQRLDEGGGPQRHPLALRHLPQPRKRLQMRRTNPVSAADAED
jgi:hypothetical protein